MSRAARLFVVFGAHSNMARQMRSTDMALEYPVSHGTGRAVMPLVALEWRDCGAVRVEVREPAGAGWKVLESFEVAP